MRCLPFFLGLTVTLVVTPACGGDETGDSGSGGSAGTTSASSSTSGSSTDSTTGSSSQSGSTSGAETSGSGGDSDTTGGSGTSDSGGAACGDLGEEACTEAEGCTGIYGQPLDGTSDPGPSGPCWAESVFLGCMANAGCGDAISYGCESENSTPHQFPDTCLPDGWDSCDPPDGTIMNCP